MPCSLLNSSSSLSGLRSKHEYCAWLDTMSIPASSSSLRRLVSILHIPMLRILPFFCSATRSRAASI